MSDDDAFLESLFGSHRAPTVPAYPDADPQDAVGAVQARGLPRHRARRRQWKPPAPDPALQTVQAQHVYDRDTFVR